MEIRIDKQSEVPVHRQVSDQIMFLIVTEKLKTGDALPSVRELARRLKIHHNTVSQAYQRLVQEKWLVRRRGSRLVVGSGHASSSIETAEELDELINATIRFARTKGHSLQALRERVRQRLLEEPPDHILVVEQDEGLRRLMEEEIRAAIKYPVDGCSREDLLANPGRVIGALTVAAQHALAEVDPLIPKNRPAIGLRFAAADQHLQIIRNLRDSSVIGVVSVSTAFLATARSLLAPALGQRHVLRECLIGASGRVKLDGIDVIFGDSVARRSIKNAKMIHYQLLAKESLEYLANAMQGSTRHAADSPAVLGSVKKNVAP